MAAYSNILQAGSDAAEWGIATAESGLFVESQSETVNDPYEFLLNNRGQRVGFAYGISLEHVISINGEVNGTFGTTGVLAHVYGTAYTLTNDTDSIFGATAGQIWLTGATLSRQRSGWQSVSMNYSRYPEITAAA